MAMISKRKEIYPLSPSLVQYLHHFGRWAEIPLVYDDLLRFTAAMPYENPAGDETLWLTVAYPPEVHAELQPHLTKIYAMLKIGGDLSRTDHLAVERIDFGDFGNSRPFRIRIVNLFNGNADHYYVKCADASRIYGLELEHLLSPFRINYLVRANTLIEEHIAGVPGNMFIADYLGREDLNRVRIAKEFVKFAERCYLRLLGDMRSVNYVVDITPDFEEVQYRVRPIDFDQQCHEKRLEVYRPHLFPDNKPVDELVRAHLNVPTIVQYRQEERSQTARRIQAESRRYQGLVASMRKTTIAPPEHVESLALELNDYHGCDDFTGLPTMADLVVHHLERLLADQLRE
ncbi:MAG: hypothetical protein IAE97_11100 [Chthoniobacterales bacterium]|nr:hypothetical protein [Chthoniobacterales bacterium]